MWSGLRDHKKKFEGWAASPLSNLGLSGVFRGCMQKCSLDQRALPSADPLGCGGQGHQLGHESACCEGGTRG